MTTGSDTANAPNIEPLLDVDDVMQICSQVGGSFAQDPLMLYAVASSPEAYPEVQMQIRHSVERAMQKNEANLRIMNQCGIKRLGSTEEQEGIVNRMSHKRLYSDVVKVSQN